MLVSFFGTKIWNYKKALKQSSTIVIKICIMGSWAALFLGMEVRGRGRGNYN